MGGTNCVGAKAEAVRLVEGNLEGCRGARGGFALRNPLPEVVEASAGLLFARGGPSGTIETADHLAYGLTSDAELESSLSQSDLGMGKQKSAKVLVRYGGDDGYWLRAHTLTLPQVQRAVKSKKMAAQNEPRRRKGPKRNQARG
jgi:hypothetical protein